MLPERKKDEKKHIVIVGAGFGGVYAYRNLLKKFGKSVRYTIISPDNYFLFTPLLHEVATGSIEAKHIVEPLRAITEYSSTKIVPTKAESIDLSNKKVRIPSGEISYDYLVVATGARTNYFNVIGAEEYTIPLKSLDDAVKIRDHIITTFEEATCTSNKDTKRALLSFVVVGGGPTGVELATEISDLCFDTFLDYYQGQISHGDIEITLISSSPDVVPQFHKKIRESSKRGLHAKGVNIMLNSCVAKVDGKGVVLSDGTHIEARTVVWASGVTPNTPSFYGENLPEIKNGRVVVDQNLNLIGREDVFVLGDVAHFEGKDGKPLPQLAQVAVAQGRFVAKKIFEKERGVKKDKPFVYKSKGEMLSLGEWHAAGRVFGISISGPLAWFIWRTIYLFKFISFSKRFKIMLDWTINIFTPRDITRIKRREE